MSDPAKVAEALKNNFLFGGLTDDELGHLGSQVWTETIPAGSLIVREGDTADALYLVLEGGVNVIKSTGQFLSYLGVGGFFGEMALFLREARRSASCLAASDTTCLVLGKSILEKFADEHPVAGIKIYRVIIETLAERLQTTSADLAHLMATRAVPAGRPGET
jgi:CRP-like cAMP-binding protein